jgi:mono/diheme cytochrome c family protein
VPQPLKAKDGKTQLKTADGKVVQLPDWLTKGEALQEKINGKKNDKGEVVEMGGRQLFTERGCLACHQHSSTTQAGDGFASVTSTADFGPNLSDLAAKIKPAFDDPEAKWRWLVQWIMNPNVHFPRTRMPVTHLTEEEAAKIAAWLMSQPTTEWKQPDPPAPDPGILERLARVYLDKSLGSRIEGAAVIERKGLTDAQEAALRARGPDADELRLAQSSKEDWPDKLKWYVGRKALVQLGCYGCHDIPGFEFAKPVGTPLNDWGKKDPERLAFEDAIAWVKNNYHVVAQRDDPRDPKKPSIEWRNKSVNGVEKRPYEQFFFEALDHHQRDGFLHQKLDEPRSYDYDRMRAWDERLRMPQFRFSRTVAPADASTEERAQVDRDEAEAREAVMTFILGLVAEPIPTAYVHNPSGDRGAIVKGKQVLEKYNCAGCHTVDAGRYEFKLNPDARDGLEALAWGKDKAEYAGDHRDAFHEYNEWTGVLSPHRDRMTIRGVPTRQDANLIRLTEAARFLNNDSEVRDVPASRNIDLTGESYGAKIDVLSRSAPYGGTFVDLLVPYLEKRDKLYEDEKNARAALPPPLLREGEKAQPEWLFRFLRDPFEIRPMTVLRMPKFNMSDDEAMALVNYFAANDRTQSPSAGLSYPYLSLPQHGDAFWREQTAKYIARLKEKQLFEERKNALPAAVKDRGKWWEQEGAYAFDAFRLMTNYNNACMGCHSAGELKAKNPPKEQGPPLELSWQRLRPEWTARWLANPERLISYPTPMPANFKKTDKPYPEFEGSVLDQVFGVRDILMFYPKVSGLPAERSAPPPDPENKPEEGKK